MFMATMEIMMTIPPSPMEEKGRRRHLHTIADEYTRLILALSSKTGRRRSRQDCEDDDGAVVEMVENDCNDAMTLSSKKKEVSGEYATMKKTSR